MSYSRELKKFPPLRPEDLELLTLGHVTCPGCTLAFKAGDVTTLIPIGPGDSAEAREQCRQGLTYTAVAIPAHWACVTGEEDAEPADRT